MSRIWTSYVWHIPRCATCWRYLCSRTSTKFWPPFWHDIYQIYLVYILVYIWYMSGIKGGQNFVEVLEQRYPQHVAHLGIYQTYDMHTWNISAIWHVYDIHIIMHSCIRYCYLKKWCFFPGFWGAHHSHAPANPLDIPNDSAPDQHDAADFELPDGKELVEALWPIWGSVAEIYYVWFDNITQNALAQHCS